MGIPSTSIYLSDPDCHGYLSVYCHLDCRLDYHMSCWEMYKEGFINVLKTSKTPSERDFFNTCCFTPDCGGIIIRINITDLNGDVKTLENEKVIEKIEKMEEEKKEEEKRIKEQEEEIRKRKKHEDKIKKLERKNKERTPPIRSDKENGENKDTKYESSSSETRN